MSTWYQFQGPVQGGGFGPFDDAEQRRRRKHYRDAGAPFMGGTQALPTKFERMPQYDVQVAQAPQDVEMQAPAPAAPRQAAAVDLGAGPVQQPVRDFRERQPSPEMPERMTNIIADLQEQKRRAGALFEEDEPVAAQPLVATGGMPPRRPGKPEEDLGDDPRAPRPRIPRRDPLPVPGPGPMGPARPPAGRPTPAPQVPRAVQQKQPVLLPEPVQPRRRLKEPGPVPVSDYGRKDPLSGTARRVPFGPQTGVKRKMVPRKPGGGPGQPYGGGAPPPGGGGPPGPPGGGFGPQRPGKDKKTRRVRFGKDEVRMFREGRAIHEWNPYEREKRMGYQQYGQMQGRKLAQREHQIVLDKIRKQNRNLVQAMRQRGGQEITARDQRIAAMQQAGETLESRIAAGTKQLGARDRSIRQLQEGMGREGLRAQRAEERAAGLQRKGEALESIGRQRIHELQAGMGREGLAKQAAQKELSAEKRRQLKREAKMRARYQARIGAGKTKISELQQGMGREGLRAQRAEERAAGLQQKGEALETAAKAKMRDLAEGMGREGLRAQKAEERAAFLLQDGNRRIQELEKKIDDGKVSRAAAQSEIDDLSRKLAAAARAPAAAAPQQQDNLQGLKDDIAALRRSVKNMPRGAAAAPIVVQGGAGGGGASSSAGGSSAASGGGAPAAAPRAAAPDLSKVVEAVKAIAESSKKKAGGGTKGITRARRTYTDKRKAKIAELRALKSKRIREFAAKTKKLPKAERTKQRREYKKKVEAQFKEAQTRFPTARGLKSVGVLRELIRKIDAFKTVK